MIVFAAMAARDLGESFDLDAGDLEVESLGPCEVDSPLSRFTPGEPPESHFIDDAARVVFEVEMRRVRELLAAGRELPSVEPAGPRAKIYFNPEETGIAIVTCGGLCPGLNNVIRGITLEAYYRYGVRRTYGIRYGFQGFIPEYGHEPMLLTPKSVAEIHTMGGTVLASSRGRQDPDRIVDWLAAHRVGILFVIGGDGSQRGGLDIHAAIKRRGLKIAVVGVPKTIDNDMVFLDKSFGFETAFARAVDAMACAHAEAKGAPNGVGLVKLMGRASGFIACHAALARNDANFVLIPEVPFALDGEAGFLAVLERRLKQSGHAVILVAEGAGQHLLEQSGGTDASGNIRLGDIGVFLKDRIEAYFKSRDIPLNLKYIDPSYLIRSVPADPQDALYCSRLAQNAVHAGMAGKTALVVGRWLHQYVHVPSKLVTRARRKVDPARGIWQSVLATTGQPARIGM